MRRVSLATLVLAAVLCAGTAVAQTEEQFEIARQSYMTGEQLFNEGRFQEAVAAFQQSYDIVPFPDTMFNIAAGAEALGQVDEARARYQAIVNTPDVAPDLAAQAQESVNRLAAAGPGPTGPGPTGPGPTGPGPTGQYPTGQYPTGQYPTQGGGLTRRQMATIWDAVDRELPHTGPGLYFSIGGGGPVGADTPPGSGGHAGIGVSGGLLWRIIPWLSILGEFQLTMSEVSYTDATTASDESADTMYLDVAAGLRGHFLASGFWDPWADIAVGYAVWNGLDDIDGFADSYTAALVRFGAGLDLFVTQYIALGVRFDFHLPIYYGYDEVAMPDSSLPYWWNAGLSATFYFLSI